MAKHQLAKELTEVTIAEQYFLAIPRAQYSSLLSADTQCAPYAERSE